MHTHIVIHMYVPPLIIVEAIATSLHFFFPCSTFSFFPCWFVPSAKDNPADYAFFFDTSRRRTCYIAPERLVYAADFSPYSALSAVSTVHRKQHYTPLTYNMDIFSLGSVNSSSPRKWPSFVQAVRCVAQTMSLSTC